MSKRANIIRGIVLALQFISVLAVMILVATIDSQGTIFIILAATLLWGILIGLWIRDWRRDWVAQNQEVNVRVEFPKPVPYEDLEKVADQLRAKGMTVDVTYKPAPIFDQDDYEDLSQKTLNKMAQLKEPK